MGGALIRITERDTRGCRWPLALPTPSLPQEEGCHKFEKLQRETRIVRGFVVRPKCSSASQNRVFGRAASLGQAGHCEAHRSRIVVVVWIGAVLLLLRAIKSLDSRNRSRSFVLIPRGFGYKTHNTLSVPGARAHTHAHEYHSHSVIRVPRGSTSVSPLQAPGPPKRRPSRCRRMGHLQRRW